MKKWYYQHNNHHTPPLSYLAGNNKDVPNPYMGMVFPF